MTIVLGGGVAGLSAAYHCNAPIYEASNSPGGVARSKNVSGFVFDYGIHVLQVQQPAVMDLLGHWKIDFCHRTRHALIYSHRTYTAYPFQINTAGLPLGLRWRCLWHYFNRRRNGEPANYREWILQQVGKGFGETFLIPYSQKFWTIDPSQMTSDWTSNRVPPTSALHVLRGALLSKQTLVGTNARFRYPSHHAGYGAIPEKMAQAVTQLHLGHRATAIDVARHEVEFNGGAVVVGYERMISTIPLPELIALIPNVPDEVNSAAARLKWNSIFIVNLGVDRPGISPAHWIHFPEKEISFFRISFPENLGPGLVPQGTSSVSAEIAYSNDAPIDKEGMIERVLEDLKKVGILRNQDRILIRDTMDVRYGYVIYDKERRSAVRTIRQWLESVDIYPTGRYGHWAYLWSHEAILAGRQTAMRLAGRGRDELSIPDEFAGVS